MTIATKLEFEMIAVATTRNKNALVRFTIS
jgi:hypothetical protein